MSNNKNFSNYLSDKEFEDLMLYVSFLGCAKIVEIIIKCFQNGGVYNDE